MCPSKSQISFKEEQKGKSAGRLVRHLLTVLLDTLSPGEIFAIRLVLFGGCFFGSVSVGFYGGKLICFNKGASRF